MKQVSLQIHAGTIEVQMVPASDYCGPFGPSLAGDCPGDVACTGSP